jgi:hypothetical protein
MRTSAAAAATFALVSLAFAAAAPLAARAGGSEAEVDAYARAAGNRRADAVALGTVLFDAPRRSSRFGSMERCRTRSRASSFQG